MPESSEELTAEALVTEDSGGLRVDRFVAEEMGLFRRSQFAQHRVTIVVNGTSAKPSRKVRKGDLVIVRYSPPEPPSIDPEEIPLDIVYEDDAVIVINKAQGVVVHPAAGNWTGTIAQGLLHHLGRKVAPANDVRPGIVHRLDKETSGVLIAAKSPSAKAYLAEQFRARSVEKVYVALVRGTPPVSRGVIDLEIRRDPNHRKRFTAGRNGGKPSRTEYEIVRHLGGYSLLRVHPLTGRTHQIRVHLQVSGCPVLGDPLYSRRDKQFPAATLMLHALSLTVRLPSDGEEHTFIAPLPDRFLSILQALGGLPLEESEIPLQRSSADRRTAE